MIVAVTHTKAASSTLSDAPLKWELVKGSKDACGCVATVDPRTPAAHDVGPAAAAAVGGSVNVTLSWNT